MPLPPDDDDDNCAVPLLLLLLLLCFCLCLEEAEEEEEERGDWCDRDTGPLMTIVLVPPSLRPSWKRSVLSSLLTLYPPCSCVCVCRENKEGTGMTALPVAAAE